MTTEETAREVGRRALKVLVTGANGFMGSHMVELLGRHPYDARYCTPVATDIGPEPNAVLKNEGARYERCDLRDPSQVNRLVRGNDPFDIVFHVAGLFNYSASYKDLYEVNVAGSLNLLQALSFHRKPPKRIVVWGAAGVYDFSTRYPQGVPETAAVNPKGGYLTTKYHEERLMLSEGARLGIPVTVIRPGGVYGPRSNYGVALSIKIAARGGMAPFYFGPGKTRAGMVHVQDVCDAAAFLAERDEAAGEIYNVNDDSAYTTAELMRTCSKKLGFPLLPVNFPIGIMRFFIGNLMKKADKLGRVSRMNPEMTDLMAYDALLDASKLKALGWKPRYPDSINGLLRTITSYETEGQL